MGVVYNRTNRGGEVEGVGVGPQESDDARTPRTRHPAPTKTPQSTVSKHPQKHQQQRAAKARGFWFGSPRCGVTGRRAAKSAARVMTRKAHSSPAFRSTLRGCSCSTLCTTPAVEILPGHHVEVGGCEGQGVGIRTGNAIFQGRVLPLCASSSSGGRAPLSSLESIGIIQPTCAMPFATRPHACRGREPRGLHSFTHPTPPHNRPNSKMTPQADSTSSSTVGNPQAASASSKAAASSKSGVPPHPTVPYKTTKETVQVAMTHRDDGNMGIFRYVRCLLPSSHPPTHPPTHAPPPPKNSEALAMLTLGLIMAWYYIVVIVTLLCFIGLFFAAYRTAAVTVLVLMYTAAKLPLDYKGWDAFCNSYLFTLWRVRACLSARKRKGPCLPVHTSHPPTHLPIHIIGLLPLRVRAGGNDRPGEALPLCRAPARHLPLGRYEYVFHPPTHPPTHPPQTHTHSRHSQ